MIDIPRPSGSQAWSPVSYTRAQYALSVPMGYEVEFKRFLGRDGWRPMTSHTQHETRTLYRARERKLNSP